MSIVHLAWRLAVAAAALTAPASAAAQVLEIGGDGSVVTYSGPTLYTSGGVRALRSQPVGSERAPRAVPPAEIAAAIDQSSLRHAVSAPLLRAVAWQESRFNQAAVSRKGALGVMQLMPETAKRLGVDASDVRSNVDGGAAYLAMLLRRFNGDLSRALAAYNAGPEAVERYGGIPPYAETQQYVRAIVQRLASRGEASGYAE